MGGSVIDLLGGPGLRDTGTGVIAPYVVDVGGSK
jgi:hypothetical protein